MGVSDATIAPRRLASASVHARASLVRAATRWGSPTATKPRRAALVRRGLVKWREDAARARRHGRAPSLRPPSACAGRHLAARLRLPARLRSVASRDSARAGVRRSCDSVETAAEMRTPAGSRPAFRVVSATGKTPATTTILCHTAVGTGPHEATRISAPGPMIVFGLLMGRAEDLQLIEIGRMVFQ